MTRSNITAVKQSKVVFIAVKPHIVSTVLREVYDHVTSNHIIVSIAGGITLETLEKVCQIFICCVYMTCIIGRSQHCKNADC